LQEECLIKHLEYHEGQEEEVEENNLECYYCGIHTLDEDLMNKHECLEHGKRRNTKRGELPINLSPVKKWGMKACKICGVFVMKKQMYHHKLWMYHMEDFVPGQGDCVVCGQRFFGIDLEEHNRIMHEGRFHVQEDRHGYLEFVWNGTSAERENILASVLNIGIILAALEPRLMRISDETEDIVHYHGSMKMYNDEDEKNCGKKGDIEN
jgi:hypothetical protein